MKNKSIQDYSSLESHRELPPVKQFPQEIEEKYKILSLIPAGVYICDYEGRITYFNRRAAELWGYEPKFNDDSQRFSAGTTIFLPNGTYIPPGNPIVTAVRQGRPFQNFEAIIERPDTSRFTALINIEPISNDGKVTGAIIVFQDISDRKQAEEASCSSQEELGRMNRQLLNFIETASIGLHWIGPDGIILWANEADMKLLGYQPEEYIGRHIAEFYVDPQVIENILTRLRGGEQLQQFEAQLKCKDGSIKQVCINSSVLWEDGKFIHTQCFVMDITERKRSEWELARLAAIIEGSEDAIISKNLQGIITSFNPGAERIFGYRAAELIGKHISVLHPAERNEEFALIRERIGRGEKVENFETTRLKKDGTLIDISATISPVRDSSGQLIGISKVARNITWRKYAEGVLRDSEARYRELVHSLPAAVYTCDKEGRLTLYNEAAVNLWGRIPKIGQEWWCGSYKIYRPDGNPLPLDQCPMAVALREGRCVRGIEIIIERPDGSRRNILPHPEPLRDATGAAVGAINMLVDITDRKKTEIQLAAMKDDLALQVKALTRLHKLAIQLAGTLDLNVALHAVLETIVEVHGADFGILSLYDPVSGCLCPNASIGFSQAALKTVQYVKPEMDVGACGTAFATKKRAIIEDVETDFRFACYLPFARMTGFKAVHSTPILTKTGDILGVISVQFKGCRKPTHHEMQLADLCARHAAEAIDNANLYKQVQKELIKHKKTEEELFKSNMDLEQFAYIASHDLQEPLHMISSFVDLLVRRAENKLGDKEKEYLEFIKQGSKQAKVLIEDLLEYSRTGRGVPLEKVNLHDVMKQVESSLKPAIQESKASIRYNGLPTVKAGHVEMLRLFQNLISNAIKYRSQEPPEINITYSRKDDNMWLFSVTDNGIGIDQKYHDRIFAMFQRLHSKAEYSGTGIGLAICKKIVEYHGGKIWVESEPGKGARFYFTITALN